ncbi:MAG: LamG domain-containing protein [Acidobacteriia bacterium]|nr:LamG domain-containing protein [Terriglobia bacterium]
MSERVLASTGWIRHGMILVCWLAGAVLAYSQTPVTDDPPFYGPFNGVFLQGGDGLNKRLAKNDSVLRADSPWSLYGWVKPAEAGEGPTLLAGLGDPAEEFSRYLAWDGEHAILWMGKDNSLSGAATLAPGKWHFLAATFDGEEFRLYKNVKRS